MKIEKYSHVLHIVSQVEGVLDRDRSAMDVFRATFPAGTMTGAPKVRAMQIIDELEPDGRFVVRRRRWHVATHHTLRGYRQEWV
jgi:anthranilate synthase component 1